MIHPTTLQRVRGVIADDPLFLLKSVCVIAFTGGVAAGAWIGAAILAGDASWGGGPSW